VAAIILRRDKGFIDTSKFFCQREAKRYQRPASVLEYAPIGRFSSV
jgi:hypothetical protein